MLFDETCFTEERDSLKAIQSDLDHIEALLETTNKRFIRTRPTTWGKAKATTAIYLARIGVESRFKFWLMPENTKTGR